MDTDVIVVGAGPVGLMLAGELSLGGAGVVVVERLAEPATESRASTLHARTMELFDQRGLLDRVGTAPHEPMSHFGGLPLDLRGSPSRFAGQWKVPQARVERILAEWATGLGARIRRGCEVRGLTAYDSGVGVVTAGTTGERELTARYVVGCDGERSSVRRAAGIEFPGTDATRRLLRADVAGIRVPNRRFQRLPHGLAISARRPDGVTRVMVARFDEPVDDRPGDATFAEVVSAWRRVTGEDLGAGEPLWVNAFSDAARQARHYRAGRVLLAGDAAHQQMPAGGQAINLGLQDAANLGWKLAAVVRGTAPDDLLDTYHAERHMVGRRVLDNIRAQALLLLAGPEIDAVRQVVGELIGYTEVRDRLAATISGLDVSYPLDDETPADSAGLRAGSRMPHLPLGPHGTTTTALLRTGRGVLLEVSGDEDRRAWLTGAMAGWSGRIDLVAATAPPGTPDTVLLRPDGYLAWTGDRRGDPRTAAGRWFGAPRR